MFRRWLLPYVATGTALVAAVWFFAYQTVLSERQQTLSQSAAQAERMAAFFEQNMLEILRYSDTYLKLARREYLNHGNVDAVRRIMRDFPLNKAIVSHITIIDEAGRPLMVSGHELKPGATAGDRAYFLFQKANAGDQVFISLPHKGRNTGKLTFRLVRRINMPDGAFGGVIFAAIDAANITKFSTVMRLGPNSSATLVGIDKRIRARSSYGWIGPGQDISGSRIWKELAQRPVGLYKQRSVVDDITRYYAYRRLAEFPLIVAIGVATDDIAAAVTAFETPAYLIAALISLLIVIMTAAVCREIHRARSDIAARRSKEEELQQSEERFRHAFENAPIGMALVTPEGNRFMVNQALADFLGYSVEELVGTSLSETSADEDSLRESQRLRQSVLDGKADTYRNERSYQHKLGHIVEGEIHGSLYRNDSGEAEYFVGHTIDITRRKEVEAALRESEKQLRTIANSLPVLITYSNAEKRYQYINKTGADWFDRPAGEVIGQSFVSVVGEEAMKVLGANIDRALKGEHVTFEATSTYPDGKTRNIQATYVPDFGEAGEVIGFFGLSVDLTAHKQAEAALSETEANLSNAIESISEGFVLYDPDDRFVMCNSKYKDFYPANADSLVPGARLEDITRKGLERGVIKGSDEDLENWLSLRLSQLRTAQDSFEHQLANGRWILARDRKTANGYTVGIRTDITAVKQAGDQLRRAQRLEAVGQLTGGVAHDFNNILAAIIGHLDLVDTVAIADREDREGIAIALRAAHRGAELTDRLLAYSRKQELSAETTEVLEILSRFHQLAERTIGEDIAMVIDLADGLWPIMVDQGQSENALLNLAINARDAMPDGGKLTIGAENILLRDDEPENSDDLTPGAYVRITVGDNGMGMAADVMARVFEPFYTTKDVGDGSGLGLSMVFGFVKQSGGHVSIDSEEGVGTTVTVYLPSAEAVAATAAVQQESKTDTPAGSEVILVVEDNADVRAFLVLALRRLGYTALEAEDGPVALEVMAASEGIDLLLTDVILPRGMNGREVADAFLERFPDAAVLYSSGHTRDVLNRRGGFDEDVILLAKPYHARVLAERVRQALDELN
ncbi:MAG: PAS domain S-box protein [Alphaproteobacteria bacterium]|nr:PAS domain S-box protein [Alphaproteobacteria bacterium]